MQQFRSSVLDISVRDIADDAVVLFEQIEDGEADFCSVVTEEFVAEAEVPEKEVIVVSFGESAVEFMSDIGAEHEVFEKDPVEMQACGLRQVIAVVLLLQ